MKKNRNVLNVVGGLIFFLFHMSVIPMESWQKHIEEVELQKQREKPKPQPEIKAQHPPADYNLGMLPPEIQRQASLFVINDFLYETKTVLKMPTHILTDTTQIAKIFFSPDGQNIATISRGNTAKIWVVDTGQLNYTINDTQYVKFSPDSKSIVTAASNNIVTVRDATSGTEKFRLDNTSGSFTVQFSPDSKNIAAETYGGHKTQVWNADTGKLKYTLEDPENLIMFFSFSPDGKNMATTHEDGTAKIYDVYTGKLKYILAEAFIASFSPDGKNMAIVHEDFTINIYDVHTRKLQYPLAEANFEIFNFSFDFSPDGKSIITTQTTTNVSKVYDTDTGQLNHIFDASYLAFSPDSKSIVTAHKDESYNDPYGVKNKWNINIYDANTGIVKCTVPPITQYDTPTPLFSPDSKSIALNNKNIFNAATGKEQYVLPGNRSLQFNPNPSNPTIATISDDGKVKIWKLNVNPPAKQWILQHILPLQASLIARAFTAIKNGKSFVIKEGTDDAQIWTSFPDYVREYLNLYLDIKLQKGGWRSWWPF